jgi:myo-inositol-1-phosphate synthase
LGAGSVRVGIVGVGNCASAFVQGLSFYREARSNEPVPGLMNAEVGGYHVSDIEVSAAFDVAATKVGRDVSEAILAEPNNTCRFAPVAATGVRVERGPTHDGLGRYLSGEIEEASQPPADVAEVLRRTRTDILVSYLPVGSQRATEHYAEAALEAGCAFVNCIPVFIASDREWRRRFENRGVPIIGDDIKSQVGATIVHRALATCSASAACGSDRTYQLNFGGNTDFLNMLERSGWNRRRSARRAR